jgi:hypothetical protein
MTIELNSQICTTREQSERLLALGLKKETADCILVENPFKPNNYVMFPIVDVDETLENEMNSEPIPAWSLHRLIEMIPTFIDIGEHSYMFSIIQGKLFSYDSDIAGNAFLYGKGSVYDSVIYTIEWLIKIGEFNKNYLDIH